MTTASSPVHRAGTHAKAWIVHPRVLLAIKTAIAVGIAWLIAPLMPGVADNYPYYAPLGAIISMSPTLMGSVRRGAETLAALAIGIALAAAVLLLWEPNVITISVVVGIGVLVAGSQWLASGGEYVAVAALFVLIIGGPDADSYSIGYLVQSSVGIAVGLAVNILIFPPLNFSAAVLQLADFRSQLAAHLNEIAEALVEEWPPEHEAWAGRSGALVRTAGDVRGAISHADESRRLNPRARRHRRNIGEDYQNLTELETITFHVRDLTDVLSATIWEGTYAAELPEALREPLSVTIEAVAAVFTARNAGDDITESVSQADEALDNLLASLDKQRELAPSALTPTASISMDLRRILAIMRTAMPRHTED